MDLKNLDLSNWMNNQKPTEMSGLFIFDAGFTKKGALDKINMNLEMVESRLFNQGEISVHGQLFYSDSVLSTIDPNLIDWPNLPSIKVSPSYGCKEYIFSISLKYSPGDLGSKFSSKISG